MSSATASDGWITAVLPLGPPDDREMRHVHIPVGDQWPTVWAPHPMTEDEWERFMTFLGLIRPAVVQDEPWWIEGC